MSHAHFAERFAAARGRKRLTLRQVADACGVSAQAVKKWEDGLCYPSSGALIAFARLADCSAEWLMDFRPLDFHSTEDAPQGRHAKYWVRAALDELGGSKARATLAKYDAMKEGRG
jgi:transcriptional regulator with XRE-family HTH domain